jgi:hypothetical protein
MLLDQTNKRMNSILNPENCDRETKYGNKLNRMLEGFTSHRNDHGWLKVTTTTSEKWAFLLQFSAYNKARVQ